MKRFYNKIRIVSLIYYLSLCMFLIFLFACANRSGTFDDTESGSISFSLNWRGRPALSPAMRSRSPSGDVCIDYGITDISAEVYDSSDNLLKSASWKCDADHGTISDVPAGSNMKIIVKGFVSGSNTPSWQGVLTNIEVIAGQTTNAGNVGMNYIGTDTIAPEVISTNPSDGDINIPINISITATFSEKIIHASLNTSSFILESETNRVSGSLVYNTNTLTATFTLDNNLAPSISYTATITSDVQDMAGNSMDTISWSFTTKAEFTWYKDTDGDKYSDSNSPSQISTSRPGNDYYLESQLKGISGDCDDNDATRHYGAVEIPNDGIDQDCDGEDMKTSAFLDWDVGNWDESYWN